jgi:hypothetical protein
MRTILAQDGELQVVIEWRNRYGLPIHSKSIGHAAVRSFDLGQLQPAQTAHFFHIATQRAR